MAKYRYTGPGPIEVLSGGEVTRPGDVREFDAVPDWGPWEPLDEPEAPGTGQQSGAGLAPAQAAADGGQPIVAPLTVPITPEGM